MPVYLLPTKASNIWKNPEKKKKKKKKKKGFFFNVLFEIMHILIFNPNFKDSFQGKKNSVDIYPQRASVAQNLFF